jgi:hypothetical protein
VDGVDPAATLSGIAATVYLALWNHGEEIDAARDGPTSSARGGRPSAVFWS